MAFFNFPYNVNCVFLKANAFSGSKRPGRIGGTPVLAETSLHACMVIVVREDHEDGRGALGGGSIVSTSRVVTAAHVIRGALSVAVGFYVNSLVASNLRRADATFWQPFSSFEGATLLDDVAILQFRANSFPAANVIPISNAEEVAVSTSARLASYGFTTATGSTASRVPLLAVHTVQACVAALNATESHFCAIATSPSVVCNGDNGSGLYIGDGAARRLVGVVSTLVTDCTTPAQTAFTNLGDQRIQRFLVSQSVTPVAPVEESPEQESPVEESPTAEDDDDTTEV